MNKVERKVYEEILTAKRSHLLKELGLIEDSSFNKTTKDAAGDVSGYALHLADQATDFQEREKAFLFASREGRYLHHLDEALKRVKLKDYGKCHVCKESIDTKRLKAVPHARMCINCKSKEETDKRKNL